MKRRERQEKLNENKNLQLTFDLYFVSRLFISMYSE